IAAEATRPGGGVPGSVPFVTRRQSSKPMTPFPDRLKTPTVGRSGVVWFVNGREAIDVNVSAPVGRASNVSIVPVASIAKSTSVVDGKKWLAMGVEEASLNANTFMPPPVTCADTP